MVQWLETFFLLGGHLGYFKNSFSVRGEGRRSPKEEVAGEVRFPLKIYGGGLICEGGGVERGSQGQGGCLQGMGVKYSLGCRDSHQVQ